MALPGNTFVKEHLAKIFRFSTEIAFFSLKSYLYRLLQFKLEISALKLTHDQSFSQIGQKMKELEFRPQMIPKIA